MSITDINFNRESKSLEITIKFFTDDLEKALELGGNGKIFLGTEKEDKSSDSLLQTYLSKKFRMKQNDNELYIDFLGKESEQNYTWAYLELKNYNPENKIWIENTVLIDLFEEQANKINFKNNIYSKSVTLHKDLRGAQF